MFVKCDKFAGNGLRGPCLCLLSPNSGRGALQPPQHRFKGSSPSLAPPTCKEGIKKAIKCWTFLPDLSLEEEEDPNWFPSDSS